MWCRHCRGGIQIVVFLRSTSALFGCAGFRRCIRERPAALRQSGGGVGRGLYPPVLVQNAVEKDIVCGGAVGCAVGCGGRSEGG